MQRTEQLVGFAKETVQFGSPTLRLLRTSLQLLGVKARKSQKDRLESLRSTIGRNENSPFRSRIPLAAKLYDSRHLFHGEVQRQHPTRLAFVATVFVQRIVLEFLEEAG